MKIDTYVNQRSGALYQFSVSPCRHFIARRVIEGKPTGWKRLGKRKVMLLRSDMIKIS